MPGTLAFEAQLSTALMASYDENGIFNLDAFLFEWLQRRGHAYFFLFRKNLSVTNIQIAELLALVRSFSGHTDQRSSYRLQFYSQEEFGVSVRDLLSSFEMAKLSVSDRCALVATQYGALFRSAVVVVPFFGSCSLFVPYSLEVKLPLICGYSGYIHSCGRLVFAGPVEAVERDLFFSALKSHLRVYPPQEGKRLRFTVLAHEDFSYSDRIFAEDLRHGLDDVKLYLEKYYMGSQALVSVVSDIRRHFDRLLTVPEVADLREYPRKMRAQPDVDRTRALWLIVDKSPSSVFRQPSGEQFYICYDQLYKNSNPLHIFDESMPAWNAPTTIPHTLFAAMLNLTLPCWPQGRKVILAEPFVGTGTGWLQALKFRTVCAHCGDLMVEAPQIANDNLEFFSLELNDLRRIEKEIGRLITRKPRRKLRAPKFLPEALRSDEVASAAYDWAVDILSKYHAGGEEFRFNLPDTFLDEFAPQPLWRRLILYLCLKTAGRNIVALTRGSEEWESAFRRELEAFLRRLKILIDLRERQAAGIVDERGILEYLDKYSSACSATLAKPAEVESFVTVRNALEVEERSCDVIVTDPPYGFNVSHDWSELSRLYCAVMPRLVNALRDDGQLVLCLVDQSYTGRLSPSFTHKELVIQQVLAAAEENEQEIVKNSFAVPAPRDLYRPPYYWESERSLRRAVLYFRLIRR